MLETSDHPSELVVRMPSFWQMMRAGAAFTLGAGLVTISGAFIWIFVITGMLLGALSSLSTTAAPKHAAVPPAISRSAPAPASEFEQRVQRIQHERADMNEQMKAIDEARRREKASRVPPGQ